VAIDSPIGGIFTSKAGMGNVSEDEG
jgi:hypothetical protein